MDLTDEELEATQKMRKVNKLIKESWKDNYVLCIYGKENIEIVEKALRLYKNKLRGEKWVI